MTDGITDQPEGATPLDDISGLLREDITTRGQLDDAEALNILGAVEWIESGRFGDAFTVRFYRDLHFRMFGEVWSWAGLLRSVTGARPNTGVPPELVPLELGRVAMDFGREWEARDEGELLSFIARYHHALVSVHPFNNGNGRWARLACDAVVEKLTSGPSLVWASNTLVRDSGERSTYIDALKRADESNYQPLVEYLAGLNPDR
jgi:Fic-DOC domain mobile mystery protein B